MKFIESLFGFRQIGGSVGLPFLRESVQLLDESLNFSFRLLSLLKFLVDHSFLIHLFLWLLCSNVDSVASTEIEDGG